MFANALKFLRKEHNYTMDEFIELYNAQFGGKMNKSTLSRYEHGIQEPSYKTACNIANFFGVSADFMFFESLNGTDGIGREVFVFDKFFSHDSDIVDEVYIHEKTVSSCDYTAIKIKDNSMNPRFMIGDIAIIKLTTEITSGDIVALSLDFDNVLIRKACAFNGGFVFVPFNSDFEILTAEKTDFVFYDDIMTFDKNNKVVDLNECERSFDDISKDIHARLDNAIQDNKICIIGKVVELRAKF